MKCLQGELGEANRSLPRLRIQLWCDINGQNPQVLTKDQKLKHMVAPLPWISDPMLDHHQPHQHHGVTSQFSDQSGQ